MLKKAPFDLNLLFALKILLEEQSVTRAADRLGMTQSGASHLLNKLRAEFNDPLLIRDHHSMLLTSTAREMEEPLSEVLTRLDAFLSKTGEFSAAQCELTFNIGLEDLVQRALLPDLVKRLSLEAPKVHVRAFRDAIPDDLIPGRVDLLIWNSPTVEPIYSEKLFAIPHVVIARKGNLKLKNDGLTLGDYASCDHVVLHFSKRHNSIGDERIDGELTDVGLRRHKRATVSSMATVLDLVSSTDLIATIPKLFLDLSRPDHDFAVYAPPMKFEPVCLYLLWHSRTSHSSAHQWLRSLLRESVSKVPQ
jgi:DNA-binding transcriptional LysR family regulator